ncbi:hypothetical protein Ppa06_38910 [Planomonospora parontospora subsp. parontospora]|uniref:Uncharacterized protein n=2 Tax=Planomonospora parontospora TaxID=58119 RepID=A0AA37BIL2_9ACTN|nr:hypothetical protein [Planomonospora parontospora]GGK76756.1 hypothetical protein GCM10010126_40000 [Planomonospora parontospora]GII10093.1 hypothetical protein Ppa06_38910 [Planomonospora parontospora subsp. parontospora]
MTSTETTSTGPATETPATACCSTAALQTCCAPEDKGACCGTPAGDSVTAPAGEAPGSCGCR